jgi:uncharacterized protein YjbI with pentapeptide repeats
LEIINESPFEMAYIPGRIPFPGHSLTLIVKGTFDLSPGKTAAPAKEQLYPTGDEFYEEDEEMLGGPRYASDFAYFKPAADLLLTGKCHAPAGQQCLARQVSFQVGNHAKTLTVTGDRTWKRGLMGFTPSAPGPFTAIDLKYQNSFGGPGYAENPVGKGFGKQMAENGKKIRPLPNITHLKDTLNTAGTRLAPAGFGPLGQIWKQRSAYLGTYKGKYLKENWPWFPVDFDWRYFNAAPSDMQVNGYLVGDEKLSFTNLHPEHGHYEAALPGLRIRCFVNRRVAPEPAPLAFKEVNMRPDTLWVDMDSETLVLVWRGWCEVLSEAFEEIKHLFIVSELCEDPLQPVAFYQDHLAARLQEIEKGDIEELPETPDQPDDTEKIDDDIETEIAIAEQETRARLIAAGIDPDKMPEQSEEDKKKEAALLKELGFEPEESEVPLTRELVHERFKRGESFAGEDLSGLDLSGLSFAGIDLRGCILDRTIFKNSDLSGADLSGANFSRADLTAANLHGATLLEADFTQAVLEGADLSTATLEVATFEKAGMQKARLADVKATGADFSQADLSEALLTDSVFVNADFSKALLQRADFGGSVLKEASVEGAIGPDVRMDEADLTELRASDGCDFPNGSFRKVQAAESIWENANLKGADFSFARMESADFTSAVLETANFAAADMKFTRFSRANLKGAKIVSANLFEGSFEKADLTRTDLRGSNLYAVEFLEAHLEETLLEFANIKMTKLARK